MTILKCIFLFILGCIIVLSVIILVDEIRIYLGQKIDNLF